MQTCPLLARNPYPPRDSLEYFKGNAASGAFRFLHDCLADPVVNISLIAGLFMANISQFALRSTRAVTLKVAAAVSELAASFFNLFAAEYFAIGIRCDIDNSQIDTEKIVNVFRLRCSYLTSHEKIKLSIYTA